MIIDLNNSAVGFLRQGRHKQATALLLTAIADLKNLVRDQGVVCSGSSVNLSPVSESSVNMQSDASSSSSSALFNNDGDDYSSLIDVDQKQGTPTIISVPLWTEESLAEKPDKSLIFMYAQALLLSHIGHHSRKVLIGVVLYNMALANHVRAIEKDNSVLFTVALKFYSMAVSIVRGQNDGDVKASSYWLLLALYNNMAHIYFSHVSSAKLQQCLGNIEALLVADGIEQVMDVDDYGFFLTNAMLQLSVVAAPAA
jgi:hypothetical protein